MKKVILITILTLCSSLQLVLFSQDAKGKITVDNDSTANIELILLEDNRMLIRNAPVGKKVEIYSIVGTKVKEIEIKSSYAEYTLNLPKSIYIFKIGETVRKFVIR